MAVSAGDWLDRVTYAPPPLGSGIIRRAPLQALVTKGIGDTAVTLVHAPAGFGKTTLLAQAAGDLAGSGSPETACRRRVWEPCTKSSTPV